MISILASRSNVPSSNPSFAKISKRESFEIAELNKQHCWFSNNGHKRLNDVDQTHLALQKIIDWIEPVNCADDGCFIFLCGCETKREQCYVIDHING